MRRLVLAAVFVLSWGVVTSAPALAGGNSSTPCLPIPQASTWNVPCVDPNNGIATGMLTITFNAVFHVTVDKAGDGWITGTTEGDFSFTPFPPPLGGTISYTGHFASWFGGSFNMNNAVIHDTFNVHGTGSDGSTLTAHFINHVNFNSSGVPTLVFDKAVC